MTNRHQLLGHAWATLESKPDWRGLPSELKWFWLELLVAIHHAGDGVILRCGQRFRFRTWPAVAHALNLTMHEFETRTDRLVAQGLLSWTGEAGLSIPPGLGLQAPSGAALDSLPFVLTLIQGGRG